MADRESDTLTVRESPGAPGDDETTWLLGQCIRLAHSAGQRSHDEYRNVIRLLLRDPRAAVVAVDRWIEAAPHDPMLRWSLLYVLAELEDGACLELLERQALRQMPERLRRQGVCEQSADYEELVAVMAIEGVVRLAAAGDTDAVQALLRIITRQDRRSLRRPAAVGLVSVLPEFRQRVKELLPESEHYVLDLRPATPEDFRIAITEEDLRRNPNRRESKPKPPLLGDVFESARVADSNGT
jgi:hypothetical protein